MKKPPLDPNVADLAPADPAVTTYDEEHIITWRKYRIGVGRAAPSLLLRVARLISICVTIYIALRLTVRLRTDLTIRSGEAADRSGAHSGGVD